MSMKAQILGICKLGMLNERITKTEEQKVVLLLYLELTNEREACEMVGVSIIGMLNERIIRTGDVSRT